MSSSSSARPTASAFESPREWIGASMQLPSAVMCGNRLKFWKTIPILALILRRWAVLAGTSPPSRERILLKGSPSMVMSPSSIVSRVIRTRSTVVFPEPDGPMMVTSSPAATSMFRPSRTVSGP